MFIFWLLLELLNKWNARQGINEYYIEWVINALSNCSGISIKRSFSLLPSWKEKKQGQNSVCLCEQHHLLCTTAGISEDSLHSHYKTLVLVVYTFLKH